MQNSQTTPETATATSAETRKASESELSQIAKLLAGDDGDQDDQAAESASQDDQAADVEDSEPKPETAPKGKPKNLNELAETLGVKVADLYALEIPSSGDGESRTLGELKDAIADRDIFEVDRLAWEETRQAKESEFLRSAQELNDLVAMLPRSAISKELIQAVQDKRAQTLAREERLTLAAIPDWNDQDVEKKDRDAMREHLSAYGFPSNYVDTLVDSRTLKYIRDSMQRQQRIERALDQVRTVRKPGHKPSAPASKPAKPTRTRGGRRVNNQVDEVARLLETG